jgi:hypothetical protein
MQISFPMNGTASTFYFGENVDAYGLLAPVLQPTAQANARTHSEAICMTILDFRWLLKPTHVADIYA